LLSYTRWFSMKLNYYHLVWWFVINWTLLLLVSPLVS
jgi:hypothetical protein